MEPKVIQSVSPLLDFILKSDSSLIPARLRLLFDPETLADDRLDVSVCFPFAPANKCIIRFDMLPESISEAGRYYARLAVFMGKAPGTVQGHLRRLATLFRTAQKRYSLWDFRQLTFNQVQTIVSGLPCSAGEKWKLCAHTKMFLQYMDSFCGKPTYNMDFEALSAAQRRWQMLDYSTGEAHKTPDIDPDYFETLENELPLLVMRKDVPLADRLTAALLHLEMYVGLRPSELLRLSVNAHITKRSTSGREADYLVYEVPKLSHGGQIRAKAECYMLPGAVSAFDMLVKLRTLVKGHEATDRLFLLPGGEEPTERSFKSRLIRLFVKYFPELSTGKWEEVVRRSIKGKEYHIPSLTQYRVHLCGYLYRQGVRLEVIELGMSHLTDAMIAYYVRSEDRTFKTFQRRADNIILSELDNDYSLEAFGHKGEDLLRMLPLSLSQYRVYRDRLEQVEKKGYVYEVDRYTKLCTNKITTEIRPALSYLSRVMAQNGRGTVISAFPSLSVIIDTMESINNEITLWQASHRK